MDYSTPLTIEDVVQETITSTINLQPKGIVTGLQQWVLTIPLQPDSSGALQGAAKLQAHVAKYGSLDTFTLPMPQHLGIDIPRAARRGTGSLGSNSILIAGGSVPAGVFFTIGDDPKVYVTTDEGAEVGIHPNLRTVENNAPMNFSPDLTCRYSPDYQRRITYVRGIINRFIIIVEEAI